MTNGYKEDRITISLAFPVNLNKINICQVVNNFQVNSHVAKT